MRCERAEAWITARLDGELSPWRSRRLDRHLVGCAKCRAEQVRSEHLVEALDLLPVSAEVSERLAQDTFRRVRQVAADELESSQASGWRRWTQVLFPIAAATAVVAIAVRATLVATPPPEASARRNERANVP